MKKIFKISTQALIFDMGIFLYVQFFLYGVVTHNKSMIHTFPFFIGFAFVFLMQAMFPIFMGRILVAYTPYFSMRFGGLLESAIKQFFSYTMFFIFIMGFILSTYLKFDNSTTIITLVIFGAIFSITFGGFIGSAIYKRGTKDKTEKNRADAILNIFIFLLVINILITIIACTSESTKVSWGVLYILFSSAILVFLYRYLKKFIPELRKNEFFIRHGKLINDILFAVVIITVLAFWLEIISLSMLQKSGIDTVSALIMLLLTGYLPLRILIEFEPPLTPFSILTGVLSTGYFIYHI